MSWFSLSKAMGTNYTVDPGDIVNTKTALNQLGYYDVPPHRGIDDWTDDSMFNGIKAFQKDNGLKVDGFMRPDGPTEQAINSSLAEGRNDAGAGNSGDLILAAGRREPNVGIPSQIPPHQRKPDGTPDIRHIPPEYEPSYPGSYGMKNKNTGEYCIPGTDVFGRFKCTPNGNRGVQRK